MFTLQQLEAWTFRKWDKKNKHSLGLYTHLCLLLEKLPLSNWIIQLSVGIADFLLHHKELKTLR